MNPPANALIPISSVCKRACLSLRPSPQSLPSKCRAGLSRTFTSYYSQKSLQRCVRAAPAWTSATSRPAAGSPAPRPQPYITHLLPDASCTLHFFLLPSGDWLRQLIIRSLLSQVTAVSIPRFVSPKKATCDPSLVRWPPCNQSVISLEWSPNGRR